MDRDTLIFIAFCVFILLLGVRFWQQLRERTERTEADRSIADEAVPLPAKSRRRYFILIQVIVLGGLLIYMLSWLIRDFKGAEPVLNAGFILRCLIFVFTIYIFISRGRDLLRQRVKGNKKKSEGVNIRVDG